MFFGNFLELCWLWFVVVGKLLLSFQNLDFSRFWSRFCPRFRFWPWVWRLLLLGRLSLRISTLLKSWFLGPIFGLLAVLNKKIFDFVRFGLIFLGFFCKRILVQLFDGVQDVFLFGQKHDSIFLWILLLFLRISTNIPLRSHGFLLRKWPSPFESFWIWLFY